MCVQLKCFSSSSDIKPISSINAVYFGYLKSLLAPHAMPKRIAPPTTIAPAIGAAAATKPPTAVPTALAPDAIVPIPVATEEPAVATAVPAVPSPTADNAFPRLEDAELTEFEKALTALLLALEMDDPERLLLLRKERNLSPYQQLHRRYQ